MQDSEKGGFNYDLATLEEQRERTRHAEYIRIEYKFEKAELWLRQATNIAEAALAFLVRWWIVAFATLVVVKVLYGLVLSIVAQGRY
jgi:hypothetical protein